MKANRKESKPRGHFFFPWKSMFSGADGPHPSFSESSHTASLGVLTSKGLLKWLLSSVWYNNQMKTQMKQSDYLALADLRQIDFSVPGSLGA